MALSRGARKYYRTLFLGLLALVALVWGAVDQFDIPWADMRELMWLTLLTVMVVIGVAGACVGLWMGLRKMLQGRD